MGTIHTFTVSSEIQTSCESSVDAWSKEARWNSYPQTHFYKLPKDVLFIILQYAAFSNTRLPRNTKTAEQKDESTVILESDNKKRKQEES
jgi:hypothetical protein